MHRVALAISLAIPPALVLPAAFGAPVAGRQVPDTLAQRVQACTACHGRDGRASPEGYLPRLAGKPAGYLFNQMEHFRQGRRGNAAMTHLLDNLSPDYLREIADHFSSLELPYPPPPPAIAGPAVLQRGKTLALEGDATLALPGCAACHGQALMGAAPAMPGLLGLPRDYLIGQIGAWRTGLRHATEPDCMAEVARRLSHADVSAAAAWLSAQPVPAGARPALKAPTLPSPAAQDVALQCGSQPR